jgi:hypothetical protein
MDLRNAGWNRTTKLQQHHRGTQLWIPSATMLTRQCQARLRFFAFTRHPVPTAVAPTATKDTANRIDETCRSLPEACLPSPLTQGSHTLAPYSTFAYRRAYASSV